MKQHLMALIGICAVFAAAAPQAASHAAARAGAPVARCDAFAATMWDPAGPRRYRVEAFATGPRCQSAVAVLVIRAPNGQILWHRSYQSAHVMPLAGAASPAALRAALGTWINGGASVFASTRALPPWPDGVEAPASGEFPFYPVEGMTRADWAALRARAQPVFCHVQGMESLRCFEAAADGSLDEIGVQTFPG